MPADLQASMRRVPAGAVMRVPSTVKVTSGMEGPSAVMRLVQALLARFLDQDALVRAAVMLLQSGEYGVRGGTGYSEEDHVQQDSAQ